MAMFHRLKICGRPEIISVIKDFGQLTDIKALYLSRSKWPKLPGYGVTLATWYISQVKSLANIST